MKKGRRDKGQNIHLRTAAEQRHDFRSLRLFLCSAGTLHLSACWRRSSEPTVAFASTSRFLLLCLTAISFGKPCRRKTIGEIGGRRGRRNPSRWRTTYVTLSSAGIWKYTRKSDEPATAGPSVLITVNVSVQTHLLDWDCWCSDAKSGKTVSRPQRRPSLWLLFADDASPLPSPLRTCKLIREKEKLI